MRSSDCQYTVQFYGALFREGDVWICMEVMDTSLDKFYIKVYNYSRVIPEDILGKIAFAVSLIYLQYLNCTQCKKLAIKNKNLKTKKFLLGCKCFAIFIFKITSDSQRC